MSLSMTEEAAFLYWEQLDCPTSLSCAILAKAGQWVEVLTMKVDPWNFIDSESYARANAAVCFLKKNPFVQGSSDGERKAKALQTWKAGEALCYETNEKLSRFIVSPLSEDTPSEFLRRVRRRLTSWLRHAPGDAEMHRRARHGPGTTLSSSVANPTAADKYDEIPTLTHEACWYLASVVGTMWGARMSARYRTSSRDCVQFSRGNRHVVVPKTAMTDRNIAIEPSLNVYFQLAVGSAIRARMRKFAGWDLDNAAQIHREVAKTASVTGQYSTIDLSNASDTLCKNLVRVLLRDTAWLDILEDLRSKRTFFAKKWHMLEKFSSMGNGYTFELESCIFAAICAECLMLKGHEPVLGFNLFVFGDDIIVPSDTAELVVKTLRWLGFEANKEKTFINGPFRESCGGDFFMGAPVRGFYLKTELSRVHPQNTFTLHNGVKVCLEACKVDPFKYTEWARSLIPHYLSRIGGSARLGDTVLHNPDLVIWKWRAGIKWVRAVRWGKPPTVGWRYFSESVRIACRLTGYGHAFGIDTRGLILKPELVWVSDS